MSTARISPARASGRSSPNSNVIGIPLESTIAVHHLIFGGVLDAYPRLKLVVAHGGGYLPAYSGRIVKRRPSEKPEGCMNSTTLHQRPDCCENIREMPTTYLKRLHFDTMVFTHEQLKYLVRQYGADYVLMGTDYPYDMGEVDPIGFIEGSSNLDDAQRRLVLGGNAALLLGIQPAQAQAAR